MTKIYSYLSAHESLSGILTDQGLASLGDAYVNFVYSLFLSSKAKKPTGAKTKGAILAEALRRAGLRKHMPSRMSGHMLADAAEALIVYAWLHGYVTLTESVEILGKADDPTEGFRKLLSTARERIRFS